MEAAPRRNTFAAFDAAVPEFDRACTRQRVKEQRQAVRRATSRVNVGLHALGFNVYHDSVPLDTVNDLLRSHGFNTLDAMLLCGRDGQLHEAVG